MTWLFKLFGGDVLVKVVEGVAGFFKQRQQTKQAAQAVEAKIKLAHVNKDAKLELADHELQVLRTKGQSASWKDEYVTLIVSMPIIIAVVGAIAEVFFPAVGAKLMEAGQKTADVMTGEVIDYPVLWGSVVAIALGTKPLRR